MLSIDYVGPDLIVADQANLEALVTVSEDDSGLYTRNVAFTVNWGDGSALVYVGRDASPNIFALRHVYVPGVYALVIAAQNFRSTDPDTLKRVVTLVVLPTSVEPARPAPVIIGPILPRSVGEPSRTTWNFNIDQDVKLLESNLRLILLTAVGERLNNPLFGTRLRELIFTAQVKTAQPEIESQVREAVAQWEPRAELGAVVCKPSSTDRSVGLYCTFVSRLTRQEFQVNVRFEKQ